MRRALVLMAFLSGFVVCAAAAPSGVVALYRDAGDETGGLPESWGYVNQPSRLELAGDGHRAPVIAGAVFQGSAALRLRWTSRLGGDWGIAIAGPQWRAHDITRLRRLVYWVNGPRPIDSIWLPAIALEDTANHKSTRVRLDAFVSGLDGDPATWQKVSIPLSRFEPGPEGCDFGRIKGVYHYQEAADGGERELWLDEIRFVGELPGVPERPTGLTAAGHDRRIDLRWEAVESVPLGYHVYRSETKRGPFRRLTARPHEVPIYSDFLGANRAGRCYRVTAVGTEFDESAPSEIVAARSRAMDDDALLTSVQEATFRYFYDYGHPISGLARERTGSGDRCATGGTGFGLLTIMVGAERGFVERAAAARRILRIVTFLGESATRYHGAWSHWINGATGRTVPFSPQDDGGDLVETALLAQGLLAVRQYFDRDDPVESELRRRATELWEGVEWDWYRRGRDGKVLYWHWSPRHGWAKNLAIRGYHEGLIVYLLAMASPTHPIPVELYDTGWAGSGHYRREREYYGYRQWVGPKMGGPLFLTQYSFVGFDPRGKRDKYCDYYENHRNVTLINRAYCIDNPLGHKGYGPECWGLTSSDGPDGYTARGPGRNDDGTITPTAAISAMPYTPRESLAAMRYFYRVLGHRLWGEFGFRDAFCLDREWFAGGYLAIDQGTIVPMIENYRTGLCWRVFMSNPEIRPMLRGAGWTIGDEPAGAGERGDGR